MAIGYKRKGKNEHRGKYQNIDKKRIQSWLNVNRLQLPLHNLDSDSNNIIAQDSQSTRKTSESKGMTYDNEGNPIAKDVKFETNYSLSNDTAYMDKAIELE